MVLWVFWAGTVSIFHFIDALVWARDAVNIAPVWCDICESFRGNSRLLLRILMPFVSASRVKLMQPIGIIITTALINHRLYKLSKMDSVYNTSADVSEMFSICCARHFITHNEFRSGRWLSSILALDSGRHLFSWDFVRVTYRNFLLLFVANQRQIFSCKTIALISWKALAVALQ